MKIPNKILLFTAAMMTTVFLSCGETAKKDDMQSSAEVEAPAQIVSIEEAKKMYENYTEQRANMIQKFEDSINISKKDTAHFDVGRYTWYDYKTIKQYLAYIEQEAEKAGVEISSLRFYYSNYPDQEKFANGKPIVHPRQNSIFLIPAMEHEGDQYAFTVEDTGEAGKKRAVLLNWELDPVDPETVGFEYATDHKSYASLFSIISYNNAAYGNGSTALNEGNAAPPPHK